jgi:hypothetical protein
MTARQFFIQLAAVAAFAAAALAALHQAPVFAGHEWFSWGGWATFILLAVLSFYAGRRSALSANKNDFSSLVIGLSMGKMMAAALGVIVYAKAVQPQSKLFIVPFFIIYAIFTVYETIVLTKLGRMTPH